MCSVASRDGAGLQGRLSHGDTLVLTSASLTLALFLANSSASSPFSWALEETDAAFPSILSACLVFLFASARSLPRTMPAFRLSTAWSWGPGNCSFIPANPAEAVRRARLMA